MCSVFCFLIFHSFEFFKYFCIKLTGLVITCKWTSSPVNTNYGSVNETYNRFAQTTWEYCSQMFYANHMEIYQRDINCPRNESEITPHTHSISASLSVSGTKHHTDTHTPPPTKWNSFLMLNSHSHKADSLGIHTYSVHDCFQSPTGDKTSCRLSVNPLLQGQIPAPLETCKKTLIISRFAYF